MFGAEREFGSITVLYQKYAICSLVILRPARNTLCTMNRHGKATDVVNFSEDVVLNSHIEDL